MPSLDPSLALLPQCHTRETHLCADKLGDNTAAAEAKDGREQRDLAEVLDEFESSNKKPTLEKPAAPHALTE